jgi:hypothetical protein
MTSNRLLRWLPVVGLSVVAVVAAVPAQADSDDDPTQPGSISGAVEEFGQSLCPMLVEPGSSLAAAVSELQGNTGLTPTLTGMVARLVIQTQCPALMTKVANGDLSSLKLPDAAPDAAGELVLPVLPVLPDLLGIAAGQPES